VKIKPSEKLKFAIFSLKKKQETSQLHESVLAVKKTVILSNYRN